MAREPYMALLMAAYGSPKILGKTAKIFWMAFFFLEKKKKFLMTFFKKEHFLKKFRAIFSGMALTELHLEICGAHGSLSQKGCRPLH